MTFTMEQALDATVFHSVVNGKCKRWRRNGATKLWKTRPTEYRIPVKFGLKAFDYITDRDAWNQTVHVAGDCNEQG